MTSAIEVLGYDVGDAVRFIGATHNQVAWGSNDDPNKALKLNGTYTVRDVEVHSWHTKLKLDGIAGQFNSVSFEKVKEGKK